MKAVLGETINAVMDAKTGKLLEYNHLIQNQKYRKDWGYSFGNQIGRLEQSGTNLKETRKHCIYAKIVCNHRPQKEEVNRTRIAVGGNLINCPFDCGTLTTDMITVKLLLNSVISTLGAKWTTVDIKKSI